MKLGWLQLILDIIVINQTEPGRISVKFKCERYSNELLLTPNYSWETTASATVESGGL
jgi:hypothetical protein